MENIKKLHLPRYGKTALIILVQVAFVLTAILIWGENAVFVTLVIMSLISCIFSLRTKNSGYILLTLCLVMFTVARAGLNAENEILKIFAGTAHASALGLVVFIIVSRKGKWRFREIFELAAKTVQENDNGFTQRPFPAAQINYSRDEFEQFAKFLMKHLIAVPYFECEKIVLVFSGSMYLRAMGLKADYDDDTLIAIDDKGNVSVKIQEKTYLWYKDRLSFDQLCGSLGYLFIDFFELYKNGNSGDIIKRMNSQKENVFAEV